MPIKWLKTNSLYDFDFCNNFKANKDIERFFSHAALEKNIAFKLLTSDFKYLTV